MTNESLLAQVLKLPANERAEVAQQVLLSLEPAEFGDDMDRDWVAEIQRRRAAIRNGEVQLLEWADVRRQILGELGQARSQ